MPTFSIEQLRQKGQQVLAVMDGNVMADRFVYMGREFWVTRGVGITACICQKCQRKGRLF